MEKLWVYGTNTPGIVGRAPASLGSRLNRIEREEGESAAINAFEQAMDTACPEPQSPYASFIQCGAIIDWASRGDSQTNPSAPSFIDELGSSTHPKARLFRSFMTRALSGSEQCALGAAEQLATHVELCQCWHDSDAAEPYPIDLAFPIWAKH